MGKFYRVSGRNERLLPMINVRGYLGNADFRQIAQDNPQSFWRQQKMKPMKVRMNSNGR